MTFQSDAPTDGESIGRALVDAAWNDDEPDRIAELCAPDAVVRDASSPTAGVGPDGYERYVARIGESYPNLAIAIDDVTAVDGTVAMQLSGHVGGATGTDGASLTGLEVVRVEDGVVVEWTGTLLDDTTLEAFVEGFQGDVVRPGDPDYDEARAVWNGTIDRYPAIVARCTGVADVVDAVNLARENGLLVAVRGGGHNVAGSAVCNGGIVIDLSPMRGVHVDLDSGTVRAEAGATWAELDRETQLFGLATPGGVVSTTGIAGLTLGGGMGWLRRKHGLTIDNLVSVDLVTSEGEFLTASEHENPELFWGLRGGGGNFGVVTSFEYRLHPVGPEVMFAGALYPLDVAHDVVKRWRDFVATAPEEVSSQAVFWSVPAVQAFPEETHGEPVVALVATHCGPVEEGKRVLRPLREFDEPLVDLSGPAPYTQVQQLYDPFFPEGELHYYWKSLTLDRFDDEVVDAVIEAARSRPSPQTLLPVWHHGGAMNRVDATETAYGDRSPEYLLSIDSTWADPGDTEENVEWTREIWADMHRFSDGSLYLNFPGFGEEGEELVRAAHGEANHERLVALKDEYDPENRFRLGGNVVPTEGS